jgi:RNA polymerase sigma factor (sigma-70 family)
MVDWQSAPTDVEVMRWVREGDGPAFRLLYDRYAHLLFPLALRILKDHQEAEDALQEVFVQVWQSARSYDPARGSTLAWLITLTRSRALDQLRGLRRQGWPSPEAEWRRPTRWPRPSSTNNGGAFVKPWMRYRSSSGGRSSWRTLKDSPRRKSLSDSASRWGP